MNAYISENDLENFEGADITVSYLFAFINIMMLVPPMKFLKSKKENIKLLRKKLFSIFIIDIIIRILYIMTYYHSNVLLKEIFFTGMPSSQFYLIISFLEQIINDEEIFFQTIELKQANPLELSILFFLFIFSYDKFSLTFSKHISFLQTLINLCCIYKLYVYFKDIVLIIVEGISNNKIKSSIIYSFILNLPFSALQFFIAFNILKILTLFVENSLYLIYMKIILIIFKETSKYFVIFILESLLFFLDKKSLDKEVNKNTSKELNDEKARINVN